MSDEWSRRRILAGIGVAALAGCTTDQGRSGAGSGGTPGRTGTTRSENRSDPAIANGSSTATDTDTDTDTETPQGHDETTSRGPVPEPPDQFDSEWPLPAADAGSTNHAAEAAGPTERVAELWRLVPDATPSAPVLADDTVFVGGEDGSIRALDARSGSGRWRQAFAAPVGAPWAGDTHLYIPSGEAIVALDRTDGTESWRFETPDRAAMLVAAHGVYWIDASEPAVVALARSDGSEQWRTPIADPWRATMFASGSRVFVSSGPYDSRFWRLKADTGETVGKEPRRGADFPAEQFYMDGTVYAVDAFFGNVTATPVEDDGYGWTQGVSPGGEAGGGLLSGGGDRVYYTSNIDEGPGVHALSKTDGTVAWTADVAAPITGRPVVADEAVLLPTDEGVRCFDPADGSELWSHPEVGQRLVVVDDLVYAAGDEMVRAFRPP